jgi:hypothetical protein
MTTAQKQGYLPEGERPQCGNCWVCQIGQPISACSHSGIAVSTSGWCPVWFPTESWIRANEQAAAKLGIALGKAATTEALVATN